MDALKGSLPRLPKRLSFSTPARHLLRSVRAVRCRREVWTDDVSLRPDAGLLTPISIIPGGTVHAVETIRPTDMIMSDFAHDFNIEYQILSWEWFYILDSGPMSYESRHFLWYSWYAARRLLRRLEESLAEPDQPMGLPESFPSIASLVKLIQFCLRWKHELLQAFQTTDQEAETAPKCLAPTSLADIEDLGTRMCDTQSTAWRSSAVPSSGIEPSKITSQTRLRIYCDFDHALARLTGLGKLLPHHHQQLFKSISLRVPLDILVDNGQQVQEAYHASIGAENNVTMEAFYKAQAESLKLMQSTLHAYRSVPDLDCEVLHRIFQTYVMFMLDTRLEYIVVELQGTLQLGVSLHLDGGSRRLDEDATIGIVEVQIPFILPEGLNSEEADAQCLKKFELSDISLSRTNGLAVLLGAGRFVNVS